jgi:Ca2+-binding RTX toxin-like protein
MAKKTKTFAPAEATPFFVPTTVDDYTVLGNSLANNITTGLGLDSINGGGGNDTISSGAGSDTIDGAAGADKLIGNGGNDTFVVDNTADSVVGGAGVDLIEASVSHTLGGDLNNLNLLGAAANATGNTCLYHSRY